MGDIINLDERRESKYQDDLNDSIPDCMDLNGNVSLAGYARLVEKYGMAEADLMINGVRLDGDGCCGGAGMPCKCNPKLEN